MRIGNSYKAENAARRYDHWLLDSFYFNNHERFFLGSIVRQVDNFALEDVTPVEIHQYFHRVGNVDVKNSEAHPSILQLRIARFRSSRHRSHVLWINSATRVPSLEASLLRAKRSKIQKFETIGGKNAGSTIEKSGEIFRNRCATPEGDFRARHLPPAPDFFTWSDRQRVGRRDALGRKPLANAVEGSKNDAPVAHPYKMAPG